MGDFDRRRRWPIVVLVAGLLIGVGFGAGWWLKPAPSAAVAEAAVVLGRVAGPSAINGPKRFGAEGVPAGYAATVDGGKVAAVNALLAGWYFAPRAAQEGATARLAELAEIGAVRAGLPLSVQFDELGVKSWLDGTSESRDKVTVLAEQPTPPWPPKVTPIGGRIIDVQARPLEGPVVEGTVIGPTVTFLQVNEVDTPDPDKQLEIMLRQASVSLVWQRGDWRLSYLVFHLGSVTANAPGADQAWRSLTVDWLR